MTVTLISPQELTPGQVLNGRLIISIEFDDVYDTFTVFSGGRGAPVNLDLGDRLILFAGLHDDRDYVVRVEVPTPVPKSAIRDYDRGVIRQEEGKLRARRVGKIDDEDLSDEAIMRMLGGAKDRIGKNVEAYEERYGRRLI